MAIEPITRPVSTRDGIGEQQHRDRAQHGHSMEDLAPGPFRWDVALVWFMRLLAIAWMAKGLAYWAVMLGFMPQTALFETQTLQWQSAIVFFSVIDLVAAIGLWLTSTWGGVIWVLAAMSYFLIALMVPHAVVSGFLVLTALAILVITYFVLSWRASRIEA